MIEPYKIIKEIKLNPILLSAIKRDHKTLNQSVNGIISDGKAQYHIKHVIESGPI